jgi:MFS-type transporter involved in bile tolerance (Atg22 family)
VTFGVPAFFAPFVFLRGTKLELIGMILWGIGMGAQDSCLKAVLSHVVPSEKRSTGFGIFDTDFGISWFAGSAISHTHKKDHLPDRVKLFQFA